MLGHDEVWKVIGGFSNLSKIWDKKYVYKDYQNGFQQPWLNRLADDPDEEILDELNKLDSYLGKVAHCKGFRKLLPGLKAHDIEYFSSTVAEVKSDAWIASYSNLSEIRPALPNGKTEADFKLTLAGKVIYGEVWKPRELPSSWISKSPIPIAMTDQQTEQPKRILTLHQKGNSQLPSNVIGIWVAHIYHAILTITFVDTFIEDMTNRSNVLGVVLWVRSGSTEFSSPCVSCRSLTNEGHDIYWLDNKDCKQIYLQRKFLCSVIN
jgi:hypothetical protein